MFKVHDNSAPKMDFRCVLRCASNRASFPAKPETERYTQGNKTNRKLIKVVSTAFLVVYFVRLK